VRIVRRILGGIIAAGALLWAGDYLVLRIPIPPGRQQYGSVVTRTEITATQKDKKVEFYFLPPEDTACVNSLFPHFGDYPCWWLVRHPMIVKGE
jgi:hypothetical protein